ncbi:hypothetical protein MKX01_011108 [Papaver californicum]|nr:hypothetical protein MKX01_011108 [Papaver californicum]
MEEAAKVLSNLQRPIEEQRKAKAAQDAECKKISNHIAQNSTNRIEMLDKESCSVVQVRGNYDEMEELRRQEESRQQRISRARKELAEAEQALVNLPIYESPTDELEVLRKQIVELDNSTKDKKFQKSERQNLLNQKKNNSNHCSDRLRDMEQANNKLLQALKNSGADKIYEACRWLQEHRHELKKEVYGPVLLEVTVPNRDHAPYLEGQVAKYIWESIVTQDADDRDLLVGGLKQYDVPVLNYTGGRGNDRRPFKRSDEYIGNQETDGQADRVPQLGIQDLWTPENHYRWTKSRYGGHISASVDSVSPSRLFQSSVDAGEIEKLRSSKRELEDTIAGLEEICKKLQSEQNQLESEAASKAKMLVEAVSFKRSFAENHMTYIELEAKIREMERNIKEQEKAATEASLHFETCKQATERSREQLSAAKKHAESIARITRELSQEFLEMPGKIEELEAAIQDNISQANSILFLNHNILEEYESRQQKIEAIAKKLEADEEELKRCMAEIDSLKEKWLPTLRNLVAQINKTFSQNFQEMAVAGEVSLDERDMEFDKFGILIKGWTLSMSGRCSNFQLLVRAASQLNTQQCFLLTPKLLPDLEYSEACSLLTIMNGPWIDGVSKVWSRGDSWGTLMGLAGERQH